MMKLKLIELATNFLRIFLIFLFRNFSKFENLIENEFVSR